MNYRKQLFSCMAGLGYNQGQVDFVLNKLDAMGQNAFTEKVFNELLCDFQGELDTAVASYEEMEKPTLDNVQPLTPLGKAIYENLQLAAQKKVSKSPDSIRKAIVRYRANLDKIAGAELVSAYTGGRSLTILDDSELSKVKNRWQELEASKADDLSSWESYASSHGLKEKQSFEAFASENCKSNISKIECLVFEILG